jgi:hypothetical protein
MISQGGGRGVCIRTPCKTNTGYKHRANLTGRGEGRGGESRFSAVAAGRPPAVSARPANRSATSPRPLPAGVRPPPPSECFLPARYAACTLCSNSVMTSTGVVYRHPSCQVHCTYYLIKVVH